MQIRKRLKYAVVVAVIFLLLSSPVLTADVLAEGFEAVGGFGGDEYGTPDLVMPGRFECPELKLFHKIIFVGDSRTYHISQQVDDERIDFVCKSGMGLTWLKETGIRELNSILASSEYANPLPKAIVFNFGINDLYNKNSYITYMKSLAPKLKNQNCTLYYMSVNPVDNRIIAMERPDSEIRAFNSSIRSELGASFLYIDSYSQLKRDGYETWDGLHYTAATYEKVFDYAVSQINAREPSSTSVTWKNRNGHWYASSTSSGTLYKNCWITYEGGKFHLGTTGRLDRNKWITAPSGNKYYVGRTGRYYVSQWVKSGEKYYYLQKNGVMARSKWIGSYYVNASGARI